MQSQNNAVRQLLWSLLVTLVILPLAFWDASLPQVWSFLQRADWRAVVLALALYVLTTLAKVARWDAFFHPRRIRFASLFAALIVGQTLNVLLPARLGDVARIYALRRREAVPAARVLGTIAAEKLVELAMLLLLTVSVAWFLPLPQWILDPSLRVSALLICAMLILPLVFVQRQRLRKAWSWLLARLLRLQPAHAESHFDATIEGIAPLRRRALLARILCWSITIWWLMIATNYVLFYALPIQASWLIASVLLIVLQIGVAVPSTPGRIGVFQFLANLTLALFGTERELAVVYGILLYGVTFVPQVFLAAPFIWQELANFRRAPARALDSVPHST